VKQKPSNPLLKTFSMWQKESKDRLSVKSDSEDDKDSDADVKLVTIKDIA
jgi:hypothetical protein